MDTKINNNFLMNEYETMNLLSMLSKNNKNIASRYQFGEVFTPVELIEDLLNYLDKVYITEHKKTIYSNPNLKWLDSSAGIGNFFIRLFYRLFNNIPIKNEQSRIRHIIENMLYFSEKNKDNASIINKIFGFNNIKPNLYVGDSLSTNLSSKWNINEFDIIIGNPPYNQNGISSITKGKNSASNSIWTSFINNSFQNLKQNGYLVYITPLSWLKNTHSIYSELLNKNLLYLKLISNSYSYKLFNIKIPISFFICQNQPFKNKTITQYYCPNNTLKTENIILPRSISLPVGYFSIFKKLHKFITNNNLQLDAIFKIVNSTGEKIPLPNKYSLKDNYAVDTYKLKHGIFVKKTNILHPHANLQKIIFANKSSLQGGFIDDGNLSLTGNHKAYILGPNLEIIKELFDFKIIRVIETYMKFYNDLIDRDSFIYIPDIRLLPQPVTEKQLYKLIGFTQNELKELDKF